MLLAIDVGNTNITIGLFEGQHLAHQFRLESARGRTSDEYAILLQQLLGMTGLAASAIGGAILASVVPPLTNTMVECVRRLFSLDTMVVGPGMKTGVAILIDHPREVGADRIVNAVAAHEREKETGYAVVVVDFGTATTFDVVSAKGEYLGGIICPGVLISADALFARAAKLPRVEVARPPRVVGKNTQHAMQSGLYYGYVSLVDGMVERIRTELDHPVRVIATGGLARLIAPASATIHEVAEDLTLVGLRILYDRNIVSPAEVPSGSITPGTSPHSRPRS